MPTAANLYFGGLRLGNPDSQWDVLTATETGSTVELSWPTAGGSPTSYELNIDNTIVDIGNVNSYSASTLTIGNNYNFKVRPVYSDGSKGGWSYFKNRGPKGYNNAIGGTISEIDNWNGTGEKWKIHTFPVGTTTFQVTEYYGLFDFKVFLVGGGGGGGGYGHYYTRGGRGGSGANVDTEITLSVGSYSVRRGSGGGGGAQFTNGSSGGQSYISDGSTNLLQANGGSGGVHGAAGSTSRPNYTYNTNITGTSLNYGNNGGSQEGPSNGGAGTAIIAYRIG